MLINQVQQPNQETKFPLAGSVVVNLLSTKLNQEATFPLAGSVVVNPLGIETNQEAAFPLSESVAWRVGFLELFIIPLDVSSSRQLTII